METKSSLTLVGTSLFKNSSPSQQVNFADSKEDHSLLSKNNW